MAENKKENSKKRKSGEVFYEAVPSTALNQETLVFPRVSENVRDIAESIVFFATGTAVLLVLLRVVLMILRVNGGNLLTYLLYASSYPFVMLANQAQVPEISERILYQNLGILAGYVLIAYGLQSIFKTARKSEVNISN